MARMKKNTSQNVTAHWGTYLLTSKILLSSSVRRALVSIHGVSWSRIAPHGGRTNHFSQHLNQAFHSSYENTLYNPLPLTRTFVLFVWTACQVYIPSHVRPFLLIWNPFLQAHVGTPLSREQVCEQRKLEHVLLEGSADVIIDVDIVGSIVPKISGVPEGCGSKVKEDVAIIVPTFN